MVQQIQAKRDDKSLTVDKYWQQKSEARTRKTENEIQKKKQVQIEDKRKRFTYKTDTQKKKDLDVSLASKISEIKILPHSHEDDEIGSFWNDELQKVRINVLYEEFNRFYEDIQPYSQSLPIILHNLPKVVEILMKHLKSAKVEVKKIILDIVPSLIRDTQQYLYSEFCNKMLIPLVEMIIITEMDLLEKVYNVLAHALKYLFNNIVENPEIFYKIYFNHLFVNKDTFIRQFSTDSFSYILKKVNNDQRKQLFKLFLDSIENPQNYLIETQKQEENQNQENEIQVEEQQNVEEKDMEVEDGTQNQQNKQQKNVQNQKNNKNKNKKKKYGMEQYVELKKQYQNQKEIFTVEQKVELAVQSIGQLVFSTLKGIGYFLNQKSLDIFKHFFNFNLEICQQKKIDISVFKKYLGIFSVVMQKIAKKITNRQLEDRLVFNFNDIFTVFTSVFTNFNKKIVQNYDIQEIEANQYYETLYEIIVQSCLSIIECEEGLKLDELSTKSLNQIIDAFIEFYQIKRKQQKNQNQYEETQFDLVFPEVIAIFLRTLHQKKLMAKFQNNEIVNQEVILGFILSSDVNLFTLKQSFNFVYRLCKAHSRDTSEQSEIEKDQNYLQKCYNLPQELLQYTFIVTFNKVKLMKKEEKISNFEQIYNLVYMLSLAYRYHNSKNSLQKQEKLKLKERAEILEQLYMEEFKQQLDFFLNLDLSQNQEEEYKQKAKNSFLMVLSLLKLYRCIQLDPLFEVKFKKSLQIQCQNLNQKLQFNQVEKKQLMEDYLDLENQEKFYQIPEEIQKIYMMQPFDKLSNLNYQDLLLVLKGEILQSMGKSENDAQNIEQINEILENELQILPKLRGYNNPFYLKNMYQFLNEQVEILSLSGQTLFLQVSKYQEAFDCLIENLQSKYHEIRLYSIKILKYFTTIEQKNKEQVERFQKYQQLQNRLYIMTNIERGLEIQKINKNESSEDYQLYHNIQYFQQYSYNKIFALIDEIEETDATLQLERAIKLAMGQIKHFLESSKKENISPILLQILVNYFSGYAFVRFQLLWTPIQETFTFILSLSIGHQNEELIFKQLMGHLKFYNWLVLQYKPALIQKLYGNEQEKNQVIFRNDKKEEKLNNQNNLNNQNLYYQEQFMEIFQDDYFFEADCIEEIIVYETIFNALIDCKNMVSKYRLVIQSFFKSFIELEHKKSGNKFIKQQEEKMQIQHQNQGQQNFNEKLINTMINTNCAVGDEQEKYTKKSFYKKLELFLKIFLQFQGYKQIDKEYFKGYFIQFLQKDNEKVQKLTLDNLIKYQIPALVQYKDVILNLISKENFKSQITSLNTDKQNIKDEYRKELIPVLISVLYPKLFSKKGLKHKSLVQVNQKIIFALFSGLQENELRYLFDLIIEDFSLPDSLIENGQENMLQGGNQVLQELAFVPLQRLNAYLNNLKNIFDKIGVLLYPFLKDLFNSVLGILQLCQVSKPLFKVTNEEQIQRNTNNSSKQQIVLKLVKELNKTAFKRLAELFKKFDNYEDIHIKAKLFIQIFQDKIDNLQNECVNSVSGTLKILQVFAETPNYRYLLIQQQQLKNDNLILQRIVQIYENKYIDNKVAQAVHQVLNYLIFPDLNKDNMEIEEDHQISLQYYSKESVQLLLNQEQIDAIARNYGLEIMKKIITYLQNNYQDIDFKKIRVDAHCLELFLGLVKKIIELRQNQEYGQDDLSIIDSGLEYFIKFFEAAQSKKLYTVSSAIEGEEDGYNLQLSNKQKDVKKIEKLKKEKNIFKIVLDVVLSLSSVTKSAVKFYEIIVQQLPYITDYRFKPQLLTIIENCRPEYISNEIVVLLKNMCIQDRFLNRGLDYDKIMPKYYEFNTKIVKSSENNYKEFELILLNYLSYIEDQEYSLKLAIISGFQGYFERVLNDIENIANSDDQQQLLQIRKFVLMRFIPFLQKGFKKAVGSETTMKILVKLLDTYILYIQKVELKMKELDKSFFPQKSGISSLSYFLDFSHVQNKGDENQDFFSNIFEVQLNKRIKALNILNKNFEQYISKDPQNLTKFLIPLLDFIIFTKCQEISSGHRMAFTDVTKSYYKSLMQLSVELYSKCVPLLSWANMKQILKKLMVYLQTKDDKTVVKLMGAIIKQIGVFLEGRDIIDTVNREMQANSRKISEKGIMKNLIQKTKNRDAQLYVEENEEIQKDYYQGEFDQDVDWLDAANPDGEDYQQDKLYRQMEKNALLIQKQQQVQMELQRAMEQKEREARGEIQSEEQKKQAQMEIEEEEQKQKIQKQQQQSVMSKLNFLKVSLLIPLKSLLFSKYSPMKMEKQGEKVRLYVATALTNLCAKFPEETFRVEFPRIISKLAKTLKDKRHEVREQSRSVLCEISRISGPYFLHFILKELKFYLNQGWESHILNYTLFKLLTNLNSNGIPNGSIDYCLNDLLPALIPEIFGQLEAEKNLDIGKKVPELKYNKAYESIHIISKVMNFEDSILQFITFIKNELMENLDNAQNIPKFEEMFRNILEGFNKNASVTSQSLLVVSFTLVRDAIQIIENSKKKEHFLDTTKKLEDAVTKQELLKNNKEETYGISEVTAQNKSVFKEIKNIKRLSMFKVGAQLSNFGLKLVLLGIKQRLFTQQLLESEPETQNQFEELLKLIVQCLDTSDSNMLQNALKVLKETLVWPIKFIKKHKKSIINSNLAIISKLTVSDQELVQDTFKLIQIVINHYTVDQLKAGQMQGLLEYIKQFTEQSDFLTEQLKTLKIIIEKKFVHAEIYGIIDLVKVKMITCYNRAVQSICKQIFLTFLINYPLSDKLLQSYINFLIKNTEYTDPLGRQIVYEVLQKFFDKFPEQVTNYFGEILFIALLVNQSKEENSEIINLNNTLINLLLQKLDKQKQLNLLQNCLVWIKQDNFSKMKIYNSAFIGMRLFVELGEVYQHEKFKEGFENIVIEKIRLIFGKTYQALLNYKNEMKDVKEVKQNLKDSEWKDVLADTSQDAEANLNYYNEVLEQILNLLIALIQKNRNYVKSLIFESDEVKKQNKSEKQLTQKEQAKNLKNQVFICQLIAMVQHIKMSISNKAVQLLNLCFEKLYPEMKQKFTENQEMVGQLLIPQILKSLYVYQLQANLIVENTQLNHQLTFNSIMLFMDADAYHLTENLLFNIKKIAIKALAKTENNLTVLENILDLYIYLFEQVGSKEKLDQNEQLLEFIKDEKHIEHILVPIIKLKNQEEQIQKFKNNNILAKCEIQIENMKKSMDMNQFFQQYSKIKVKLQNKVQEKKSNQKQMAILDPEQMAQMKKQKNQQRYQQKKNKIQKKYKGSQPVKFIKTDKKE